MSRLRIYISTFLLCLPFIFFAQNADNYTLSDIEIVGNKWTRDYVILRELNFKVGDTGTAVFFQSIVEENLERIKSLGMFNDVKLDFIPINSKEYKCELIVIENWYIYPSVILELSDRNFSDWWINHDHDLSRINYGGRLDHINLTGNRDKLIAQLQFGFRKKYELVYNLPYLTKDGKWGMELSTFYATQDQIAYKTENNRTVFGDLGNKETLLKRFRAGAAVFYRPTIYDHHAFRLEFHNNNVDPYVTNDLNPDYFLNGQTGIKFFMFNYHYTYDKRISQFYPIGGYLVFADFKKEGLKIFDEYNNTALAIGGEYYKTLSPKWIFGTSFKAKMNLDRRTVSFANNTGLGWGDDSLIGYAVYVIDGTDYFYSKNNFRYKLINYDWDMSSWMPLRQFKQMNIQVHNRLYFETAYVNDPTYRIDYNNTFNNRWLFSYGTAIDVIGFNNNMASFHFGLNHLFEFGYVFQYRTNF